MIFMTVFARRHSELALEYACEVVLTVKTYHKRYVKNRHFRVAQKIERLPYLVYNAVHASYQDKRESADACRVYIQLYSVAVAERHRKRHGKCAVN